MSESLHRVLEDYIDALGPYLDQVVVVGGWVPYLYTKIYANEVQHEPLLTNDFDGAISRARFKEGDVTLDEAIRRAGFEYEFLSLDEPPAVKYVRKSAEGVQGEIELIADGPRKGEGISLVGSLNVQCLPYVDFLLDEPWVKPLGDLGIAREGALKVPRPSMLVIHKVLTAPNRMKRYKTAKDLYCAFYVIDAFPDWKEMTLEEIRAFASTDKKRASLARSHLSDLFTKIDSMGVDALWSQKPQNAFSALSEDQFRQYALHRMNEIARALHG